MLRPTLVLLALLPSAGPPDGPTRAQPRVAPGPVEPDWLAMLDAMYGLSMFGDLLNPVVTTAEAVPGLFRKAGPGPVTYTPIVALGLETVSAGVVPGRSRRETFRGHTTLVVPLQEHRPRRGGRR